jgi:UPF0755 protein
VLVIKFIFRLLILLLVPIAVAVATYLYVYSQLLSPLNPEDKSIKAIEIAEKTTFIEIARALETSGILKNALSLRILAKLSKDEVKIKAGEYELSASMTPKEIIDYLKAGKMKIRELRVPEGLTIVDISRLVESSGLGSAQEFQQNTRRSDLLAKAGISASSFEGYLFPETFRLSRPISPSKIIWLMFEQSEKIWTPEFQRLAEDQRLSRHEILTLASIIEKESGNIEEQPIISSVFYNRLKLGMRLQSDPTVIYGIPKFNGNLTKADLKRTHAYNTYVNFGLPPGPICNPGLSAISAALKPAQTEFLYFVGDNKGKHIFSKNLEEHNIAVNKYQRSLRQERTEDEEEEAKPSAL